MKKILFSVLLLSVILSACQNQSSETEHYLSLMGESETWKLNGYEIMLTTDEMKVGNGTAVMKDEDEYDSDFFSFNTYIVTNGEEDRIHGGSVAGQTDISEQTTGAIEGEYTVPLDEVNEIFMTVKWRDTEANEDVEERIDLYQKPINEDTFLKEQSVE